MPIIQLEIDDQLVQEVGVKTVKEFIENQLSLLRLKYLGKKITEAIQESEINHRKEVEEARKEAWQEYKERYLKDIV
jgi:hypothetical protein